MPVQPLILRLSLPTTISVLVTTIYNMADTYFVGTLGTSAVGATGVVFALMSIIQAFGFMLGHGAGSNISRLLGARKVDDATRFASTSFFLAVGCGLLILVLGLLFCNPLMYLLGSTPTIMPYARVYGTYILLAAPAMACSCVMNNILRYEGKAILAMVGLGLGGVLNIAGDALFMLGFGMGIDGAGLSTALSQYISAAVLLAMFGPGKTQSLIRWRSITRCWTDVRSIIGAGLPSIARQGLNGVSNMMLNWQAAVYGDEAVAAMSIVTRVCSFLFCVMLGIGQGFQPVSGFNYGAKLYGRVKHGFYFAWGFGTALLAVFVFVGFVWAEPIVLLFRDDADVARIGTFALRAQCIALLCVPTALCSNMLFQSIGKNGRATLIACLRSGLCFVPVLLFMVHRWGLLGIQLAQPVTDVLVALLSLPLFMPFLRHLPPDQPAK